MSSTTETRTVVEQIVDNADERELWIVGREFERPPYFHAGKGGDTRLARALRVCVEGRITPNSDGSYTVEGSEHRSYRVTDSCSCPNSQKSNTKYCYHFVAVCLYVEWQRRLRPVAPVELGTLRPGTLPLPPTTVEARLAQAASVAREHVCDALPVPQEDRMLDDASLPAPDLDDAPPGVLGRQPGPLARPLALPLRSIEAIIVDLSRPLPPACVAHKPQSGQDIPYLHWHTVARLLDTYAPGWHGAVTRVDQVGNACAMTYRLSIPCREGMVSREATGQEDDEIRGYGDPTSNAEAMAFKRAAAKFGVGAWLYDRDATSAALAAHLHEAKTVALAALGARLDALSLERAPVLAWLKSRTGVQKTSDLSLVAIRALLLHLSSVEETP